MTHPDLPLGSVVLVLTTGSAHAGRPSLLPLDGATDVAPGGAPIVWTDGEAVVGLQVQLDGEDASTRGMTVDVAQGSVVQRTDLGPFVASTNYTLSSTWGTRADVRSFSTNDGAVALPDLAPTLTHLEQVNGTVTLDVRVDPLVGLLRRQRSEA